MMLGVFRRDGTAVSPEALPVMQRALPGKSASDVPTWREGCFAGSPHLAGEPSSGFIFLAEARIDNLHETVQGLGLSAAEAAQLCDEEVLRRAYGRWGEECTSRIFGDWVFAAWHPRERRLFLARDHFGHTALYYHTDNRVLAFATCRESLLALDLVPIRLDELYLAQVLTSWTGYHGERTIHHPIRRLPPAHFLKVTPGQLERRCYWRLEETPRLRLPRREDYLAPFLAVFDEAVRCRLRPSAGGSGPGFAAMLSGGLDSNAVAATAAGMLRKEGRRLIAFTSVPLSDPAPYVGTRFGDEFPLAAATARHAGNIDHFPVPADGISPIAGIRRMLDVTGEPGHAAGNIYWILALEEEAKKAGAGVLLSGQLGNAGISWNGSVFSQPLKVQLAHLGGRRWLREKAKRAMPRLLWPLWYRRRWQSASSRSGSAIHPDFARRLRLVERRAADPEEIFSPSPLENRLRIIGPGRSIIGAIYAAHRAGGSPEYRDPTGDPRVFSFCLSVPDWVFMDPETGVDRWLIRAAMKGRLPDEVRLNRRRGRQAGDLVPRLRNCAAEVEEALAEIAAGPAVEYLDLARLREAWTLVRSEDTPRAFRDATCVLTRGIMAGLFVNHFFAVNPAERRLAPS